jgi:hypothetical protein
MFNESKLGLSPSIRATRAASCSEKLARKSIPGAFDLAGAFVKGLIVNLPLTT